MTAALFVEEADPSSLPAAVTKMIVQVRGLAGAINDALRVCAEAGPSPAKVVLLGKAVDALLELTAIVEEHPFLVPINYLEVVQAMDALHAEYRAAGYFLPVPSPNRTQRRKAKKIRRN